MKILVGVCGIGIGHSTRQYELIKRLVARGHQVRVLTFSQGIDFFQDEGVECYKVWVPFIKFKGGRMDYTSVIKQNFKNLPKGLRRNRIVRNRLGQDRFIPDICISDYEPVTAQMAYRWKKPLVLIDQQSKFWEFSFESINGYSCLEEKKRLNLFFPKYTRRFITTFYKLPVSSEHGVSVVAPIIRSDIKMYKGQVRKNNHVLVYFSEYGSVGIEQSRKELLNLFMKFPGYQFTYYTNGVLETDSDSVYPNVQLCSLNRESFCKSLASASAVITTAGHTLLSEAIYLGIPCYVIPLGTFDQHYCAKFIQENELGYSSYHVTVDELGQFLSSLARYESNISTNEKLLIDEDPLQAIIQYLEAEVVANYYKC